MCCIPNCSYPGAGPCDFCDAEPCANHTKRCARCRYFFCAGQLSMCLAAHLCLPRVAGPESLIEQMEAKQ